jgi:Domain of unknown function (DUF3859)
MRISLLTTTMRPCHKVGWLLITLAFSAVAEAGIEGRIVGYGTYTMTNNYKQYKTPGSTTEVSRAYLDPPTFTAVTDHIRATRGLRFGIVFELTNLPKAQNARVGIILVTTHPPFRGSNGTTSTGVKEPMRITVGGRDRIVSWTGYGFGGGSDLVPGIWTFEVRSYSRLLCKKDFTVVRK